MRAFYFAILGLVVLEIGCRLYGLGDPPLYISDPQIEYLPKPGSYHRFGNVISYNAYSMRSREILHKKMPGEIRVLVVGDSVVNGGVLTDQPNLATSLLERRLEQFGPAFVGNIAAPSWGPSNALAYLQRYGMFDADLVILVLNSADYGDVPTFDTVGVDPDYPVVKPTLATQELVLRYGRRWLYGVRQDPERSDANRAESLVALREFVRLAKPRLLVVQHLRRDESYATGHAAMEKVLKDEGVRIMRWPLSSIHYRDAIHPNDAGHVVMAEAILREAVAILGLRSAQH